MPFSHGVFTRVANFVSDAANGVLISSAEMDAEFNGVAVGLSTCVLKDGTQAMTADIPMGGHKLTGLAPATAPGDAIPLGQVLTRTAVVLLPATVMLPGFIAKMGSYAVGVDSLGEVDLINNRWVAANAGGYLLTVSVGLYNTGGPAQPNVRFRKNDVDYDEGPGVNVPAASTVLYAMSSVVVMAAGDYIEVWINGTTNVQLVGGGGLGSGVSRFTVSRIF